MDPSGAVSILPALVVLASGVLVISGALLRSALPVILADAVVCAGGAGLAVGGLLLLDGAASSAWFVAPPTVAALAVVHVRLLVAPGGPMRT